MGGKVLKPSYSLQSWKGIFLHFAYFQIKVQIWFGREGVGKGFRRHVSKSSCCSSSPWPQHRWSEIHQVNLEALPAHPHVSTVSPQGIPVKHEKSNMCVSLPNPNLQLSTKRYVDLRPHANELELLMQIMSWYGKYLGLSTSPMVGVILSIKIWPVEFQFS